MNKTTLVVILLSLSAAGCNTTSYQYKEPLRVAPHSLSTLNVKNDVISSDFFRLDGAESFIYLTDSFMPIDDTSRKPCRTLTKCKTFWSLIDGSRYWYMTDTPTPAGEHPEIVHNSDNTVKMVFSKEAIKASRKMARRSTRPKWSAWKDSTTYFVEFNHPLFRYDAMRTSMLMNSAYSTREKTSNE